MDRPDIFHPDDVLCRIRVEPADQNRGFFISYEEDKLRRLFDQVDRPIPSQIRGVPRAVLICENDESVEAFPLHLLPKAAGPLFEFGAGNGHRYFPSARGAHGPYIRMILASSANSTSF